MSLINAKLLSILLPFLLLASDAFAQQRKEEPPPTVADLYQTTLIEAQIFLQKGDFEQAIFECNRILLKNPQNIPALYIRAIAKFFKRDWDGATSDLTKIIELDPKFTKIDKVYNFRGNIYFKKDNEKAFADFDKAISINPEAAEAYVGRGNTLYLKGSFDKSLADYEKAIQLNPHITPAYLGRSDIRLLRDDFDAALADLNKALELTPDLPDLHVKRGIIYGLQGKWLAAVADLRKGSEINPQTGAPYWENLVATLPEFDRYVQARPQNANAYAVRGFINLLRGKTADSEQDFKKSFELNAKLKNDLDNFIRAIKETKKQ